MRSKVVFEEGVSIPNRGCREGAVLLAGGSAGIDK
jgi:hypothetical protein